MLNKTAAHPVLQADGDLKIFLESESFALDVKHRENREPDLGPPKSGGMSVFSSLGLPVGGGSGGGAGAAAATSTGGSGKFVEHDEYFHDRKIYLDALEAQLKALLKAVDAVVAQRKALAESAGEFGASAAQLALVELSPALSGPLAGLAEVQARLRELHARQAQQDVLTLGITIDEYVRLIGSVRAAFAQRARAFAGWHAAEAELAKRRAAWDRLLRQGKSQQDRLTQAQADVADAEAPQTVYF
ncbi:Vacuolar protein sorting-associated protein 5, partial [Ascosphaera acerosa]